MAEYIEVKFSNEPIDFDKFLGKTFSKIEVNTDCDQILFVDVENKSYLMHHYQDCCESVTIEDIVGDLSDLIGEPILEAEESSNKGETTEYGDTNTWTFYKLGTRKGSVNIRWYGSSNGYYSESVNVVELV
jgi:hypothetical protein